MRATGRRSRSALAILRGRVAALAAPSDQLQNLKWFVVQGIGQGENLAFYQDVIDTGIAEAQLLLQGDQGPADVPCCVDIRRAAITQVALLDAAGRRLRERLQRHDEHLQPAGRRFVRLPGGHRLAIAAASRPARSAAPTRPSCASNVPGDNPR